MLNSEKSFSRFTFKLEGGLKLNAGIIAPMTNSKRWQIIENTFNFKEVAR